MLTWPKDWIRGDGPSHCKLMFVGEGPGWQEQRAHDRGWTPEVFVGDTGEELERQIEELPGKWGKLRRGKDYYITNILKWYVDKREGDDYSQEDIDTCKPYVIEELTRVQPEVIVVLGKRAMQFFLPMFPAIGEVQGKPTILPDSSPLRKIWKGKAPVIFPIYHPAAGMRNSEISPMVNYGFERLGLYLTGKLPAKKPFEDKFAGKEHYEKVETTARLKDILRAGTVGKPRTGINISIDTEGTVEHPWSLQFSFDEGTGFLIRGDREDLLRGFRDYLNECRPRLTFHSALHDLGVGRALGVFPRLTEINFDDTMIMAWLLQREEQGLKPLCVYHHDMKMQSFDELTSEPHQRLMMDYLTWLWDGEQVDYEERQQAKFEEINRTPLMDKSGRPKRDKAGRTKYRRTTKLPSVPKSALHKAAQRCLQSKDPVKLWGDQLEDIQVAGYNRLGPPPEATLDYVPEPTAVHYGCRDSDGTTRVRGSLAPRVTELGLDPVYQLELSTVPLIDRMSQVGLKPDLDQFKDVSEGLAAEIESLQWELEQATGKRGFNANSGDQVAAYLFDDLGLEGIKKTRGGRYSTNDKILEALEHEHPEFPVLTTIRAYRETYKLKNTFVDRIPDFLNRYPFDGRVHATFRTTRVVTGRLASSDPNILAQPEHGKFADDFKRGWIAEPGHVLAYWDESQIELRGLAHLSQDPVLLKAFRDNEDLHDKLAVRIFGGKVGDYVNQCYERFAVKEINFGIPMGMQAKGLMVSLRSKGVDVDEDDAQRWLDETLGLYKGVARYMAKQIGYAQAHGHIRCLSGRLRYIGGIRSRDERVRAEAERFAFSTPIQESAQFIMKQAEATIWNDILKPWWRQGRWVEPLYQQHDALKFEVAEGLQDQLHQEVSHAMTHVPQSFSVPLKVEGKWGYNMADVEKFK